MKWMGKKKIVRIARQAIVMALKAGADEVEVVGCNTTEEVTRFANSSIHQNVSLSDSLFQVRVVCDKRIGIARVNQWSKSGAKRAVSAAVELSRWQKKDKYFSGLPGKSRYRKTGDYLKDRHLGEGGRAEAVAAVVGLGNANNLSGSGAFAEVDEEIAVINSRGVEAYHRGRRASFSVIFTGAKGSGFSSQSARGGCDIDCMNVAKNSIAKATDEEEVEVMPGVYEVILEPEAVAELMDFFAWLGPNSRVFHEDVSFFAGKVGKKAFSSLLSVTDDPFHPGGYPMSFDLEGVAKGKLQIVKDGVVKGLTYDSYHAGKYGAENTGHALLAPNTWGPIPSNLVIGGGASSLREMISSVKHGILVTRFWYTRVVHHKRLVLTGMTRDGTFLITGGKIIGRVKNLRYTESIVDAFSKVVGVGKEHKLVASEGSFCLVPALHISKFRFSGITEHK